MTAAPPPTVVMNKSNIDYTRATPRARGPVSAVRGADRPRQVAATGFESRSWAWRRQQTNEEIWNKQGAADVSHTGRSESSGW